MPAHEIAFAFVGEDGFAESGTDSLWDEADTVGDSPPEGFQHGRTLFAQFTRRFDGEDRRANQERTITVLAVTEDNFDALVESDVLMLLDVYADWCPPCRRIAPLIEQLAVELDGRALVAKLDSEACPQLIAKLGISSLPTFIVFDKGAEVHRMVGLQSRETLLDRMGLTNCAG